MAKIGLIQILLKIRTSEKAMAPGEDHEPVSLSP